MNYVINYDGSFYMILQNNGLHIIFVVICCYLLLFVVIYYMYKIKI